MSRKNANVSPGDRKVGGRQAARHGAFLTRHGAFLTRQGAFLTRHGAFLTRDGEKAANSRALTRRPGPVYDVAHLAKEPRRSRTGSFPSRSVMHAEGVPSAGEPRAAVSRAWEREGTLYLMGVDGLTLDIIGPMVAQGELPHLARLAREGCWGPLRTARPTNSSSLWTSIATGRRPRDHGIDGFQYFRLLGMTLSRTSLRRMRKFGLKYLREALKRLRLLTAHNFDARHVRVPRFWEIVSEAGGRVGVVNWWHTWPVEPVNGFIVSSRLVHWRSVAAVHRALREERLTYPEELLEEVRELLVVPDQLTEDDVRPFVNLPEDELRQLVRSPFRHHDPRAELRFLISADRSCWRVLEYCLGAFADLELVAAYFRAPDIASHCAFQYVPWVQVPGVDEEDRRRYAGLVPQVYRRVDEMVGEVLARMRPEDTLLVCSDHGFAYDARLGDCGHRRGTPPGVLYACGREFQRGRRIESASIHDVAPTVLRLCGLPAARDWAGRCLEELLSEEFRRAHPPLEPIKTYGPRRPRHDMPKGAPETEKDIEDHLRALGYLD